ncbi:tetratricopeptide repeat protein [Thiorhodococcus minor]|uniref:Aspartate phosphatase n=1 Tax=Thiorhodococcus minor TaxID=57489 RepID=A0A6M0K047_9GAMM|nr:tetratricopeptide repeat protein [Thiorhodococcus minor]NEV62684.1 aspartate phosphatase [Thiorhodococcus minor]
MSSSRAPEILLQPVVTPALRKLLWLVGLLLGLLLISSLYLVAVTLSELATGRILQNRLYLLMFLGHLALGLITLLPVLAFAGLHLRRAWRRPNRYAVRAGLALLLSLVAVFASGILLTRFGFFEVNDPLVRRWAYWIHVLMPLAAVWLFVLHRLAGPRLDWRPGAAWAVAACGIAGGALALHLTAGAQEPERLRAYLPALTELSQLEPIPPEHLMQDAVCAECHGAIAADHAQGMHAMSSFNNPAYRASIDELRASLIERDGHTQAARLCATCHDQVPLFSGRFDRADFAPDTDPTGAAGITCLGCHAITAVDSPLGNGAYRFEDPQRYPFALSDSPLLRAVNRQLIKAKPAFHKETMLKPVHRSAEFCSSCHKVHLPFALNRYRWLRGQNHYDSFLMSGVSGHRVDSFYYPAQAVRACSDCHMPLQPSSDPAARDLAGDGKRVVHGHRFAAANTAVPEMLGAAEEGNPARVEMLRRAARVDLFGIKEGGSIEGRLHAPLRPDLPDLEPGKRYLLEVVIRTIGVGHHLTQGTVDSNELWLDVRVSSGERVIGRSGALGHQGAVDDWAYFVNAYLLDRDGNRIERRNAQDIFVALYDHQIPPGAAAVVHYALIVPPDAQGPISIEAALRYRKFDSRFLRFVEGDAFAGNRLPIVTMAEDRLTLPIDGSHQVARQQSPIPAWERWNDYGIGLLREGKRGESRQAAEAFAQVEALGRPDGALNLARVLYQEGRLEEAGAALGRAAAFEPPAPPWVLAWLTALIDRDLGQLDAAIATLEALAETRFNAARERGFDFARDYRMLTELGRTLYERARQERGPQRRQTRMAFLQRARHWLERALREDPENAATHHNLSLVLTELGESASAAEHRRLHDVYRIDDNAVERAVSLHRSRVPAADHAAEAVAIYDLQRQQESAVAADPQPGRVAGTKNRDSSQPWRTP